MTDKRFADNGKTIDHIADDSKKVLTEKEKIKAIYPHIVVSGDIDKPCYNIHWYDIEQKTMICGFGSYNLEFVRKWLQEEFEIVESDIDNLINRQQKQLDNYSHNVRNMAKDFNEQQKIICRHQAEIERQRADKIRLIEHFEEREKEVVKEFAEQVKMAFYYEFDELIPSIMADKIDELVKEMVGEGK